MFEINKNSDIKIEKLQGSKIYTIDNFYEDPLSLCVLFLSEKPKLHIKTEKKHFNGTYFEDRRHLFLHRDVTKVFNYIADICKQVPSNSMNETVATNATRLNECSFNDYKNNYWWPHYDPGYTAIIYLNYDDDECGTNLYKPLDNYPNNLPHEHIEPWVSKKRFEILKTLKPKYNRMVLFDANKFLHGMNICNKKYFSNEYRFNQVLFFEKNT